VWNKELLAAAGFLARAAYDAELSAVSDLWAGASASSPDGATLDADTRTWLTARGLHALRFFTFRSSTPSALVSAELERAFLGAAGAGAAAGTFMLVSSAGVRPARDVRLPDARFAGFLKRLPVLPEAWLADANIAVQALQRAGLLAPIGVQDVLAELRARPLDTEEATACLRWWVDSAPRHTANPGFPRLRAELVGAVILAVDDKVLPLSTITEFVNTRRTPGVHIPLDGPLPARVLPPAIANAFKADELSTALGWTELSVPAWLAHVADPATGAAHAGCDLARDAAWAERVLGVLGKAWSNMPREQQEACATVLRDTPCVPTSAGIKPPGEAYFPNVSLFPDLPVVTVVLGSKNAGIEKVLLALGVRKHVELQIVFDRYAPRHPMCRSSSTDAGEG
jgi:hypothetical protein